MLEPQYQKTLDDALEAARKPAAETMMSSTQKDYFRRLLLADPFLFTTQLVGYKRLVPRIHQVLSYLVTGEADLLAWMLSRTDIKSLVIDQIKDELRRLDISWEDPSPKARRRLRRYGMSHIDVRMSRKLFKSSTGVPAMVYRVTKDPNHTMLVTSGVDDSAWSMCLEMGDIIKSDDYRNFFGAPDTPPEFRRVPAREKEFLTKDWIKLDGRTIHRKEPCVEARGAGSSSTSKHYDTHYIDDLVTEEMTDVEIAKAVAFLSKMRPLSFDGERGWSDHIHFGTTYSNTDDKAVIASMENYMHLVVPIETYEKLPRMHELLTTKGTPTVPEVYDEAAILEEKLALRHDPLSYFRNFLLIADADTASIFPPESIAANKTGAQWRWKESDVDQRRHIIRPAVKGPKREPDIDPKTGKQRYVEFDIQHLQRGGGVDPSISMRVTADDWSVVIVARDYQGFKYILDARKGKGAELLLDALLEMDARWNPEKWGIESASQQVLWVLMVQTDDRFRFIEHKFVPISDNNRAKVTRIRILVSVPMKTGDLMLSPDDPTNIRAEMGHYVPGPKATDNQLDGIAFASMVIDTLASPMTEDEVRAASESAERSYARRTDPITHIDISSNWMECMWS